MRISLNMICTLLLAVLAVGLPLPPAADALAQDSIIARVGDQEITLSQIDTIINSSSFVGMDVPAVGTPERERARIVTLDQVISANLLYLDAKKEQLGNDATFQASVDRFSKSILAGLYRERVLVGKIELTEPEVTAFIKKNFKDDVEITDDLKLAAESMLRKEKHKTRTSNMRQRLREGSRVVFNKDQLDPATDSGRGADQVVAIAGEQQITWNAVRDVMSGPGATTLAKRFDIMERLVDEELMYQKAQANKLDEDEVFLHRLAEFKKTKLVNLRRGQLVAGFTPDHAALESFYNENRQKIVHPESREIQMVVVNSDSEAKDILDKITKGELTIYEAAKQYSIAPNAKQNLGVIGWVSSGTGFPELDKLAFSLDKGVVGGPVQSKAGWHLVKVLDIRDALYTDFAEMNTQERTKRMYLHEKLDGYVIALRQDTFPVEVNREALTGKAGQE